MAYRTRVKPTPTSPAMIPNAAKRAYSMFACTVNVGSVRNGLLPSSARPTTEALMEARTTTPKERAVKSRRMISRAKKTPAMGALNVAAMAPAAPQATRVFSRSSGIFSRRPRRRAERGADLDDGALAPDGPAGADRDRGGESFDDGDLRADPAAVLRDREHHFGNPVAAGFWGELLHEGAVKETADGGSDDHECSAEPRHPGVRRVADGCRIVGCAAEDPGGSLDEPPEADCSKPGPQPDDDGGEGEVERSPHELVPLPLAEALNQLAPALACLDD